jgi:hypothetical protein
MAISVNKCPHCGSRWTENYSIGIGCPAYQCDTCEGFIIDPDANEWELKSLLGKAAYFGVVFWTSLLISIAPVILALWLLGGDLAEEKLLIVWVPSFLAALAWRGFDNLKQIQASRERMRDPQYRLMLRQAGLLRE